MTCKMYDKLYELRGPRMWIDSFNAGGFIANGNGFENSAQEGQQLLSAGPSLILEVIRFSTTYS